MREPASIEQLRAVVRGKPLPSKEAIEAAKAEIENATFYPRGHPARRALGHFVQSTIDKATEGISQLAISERDRQIILGALDSLGVALDEYRHKWSVTDRTIYEEAINVLITSSSSRTAAADSAERDHFRGQDRREIAGSTPNKETIAEELYNNLGMRGRSDFTRAHAISIIQAAIEKATEKCWIRSINMNESNYFSTHDS